MTMDFTQCKTMVEDFGLFALVDVLNDVVSKNIAKDTILFCNIGLNFLYCIGQCLPLILTI